MRASSDDAWQGHEYSGEPVESRFFEHCWPLQNATLKMACRKGGRLGSVSAIVKSKLKIMQPDCCNRQLLIAICNNRWHAGVTRG
jgi:hypothetical protein